MEALKIEELPEGIKDMLLSGEQNPGGSCACYSLLTPVTEEDASGAATSQPSLNTPTMNFMGLQITLISGKPGVSLCAGPVTVLNGAALLSVRDAAGKDIMYVKVMSVGLVKAVRRENVSSTSATKDGEMQTTPTDQGTGNAAPGK